MVPVNLCNRVKCYSLRIFHTQLCCLFHRKIRLLWCMHKGDIHPFILIKCIFSLIILFCSYLVSKLLSIHIAKIICMIFTCHDISLQNSLLVLLPFFNVESVWISKLLEILIYISEIMLPTSSTKRGLFLSGINCIIKFLYNIRVSIHCSC